MAQGHVYVHKSKRPKPEREQTQARHTGTHHCTRLGEREHSGTQTQRENKEEREEMREREEGESGCMLLSTLCRLASCPRVTASCVACGSVRDETGCVVPHPHHTPQEKGNSCDQSHPTHHRIPPHTTVQHGSGARQEKQRPRRGRRKERQESEE